VVRPCAVHPLRMMAWKGDLAHARGMRQRTFAATVLAFLLGWPSPLPGRSSEATASEGRPVDGGTPDAARRERSIHPAPVYTTQPPVKATRPSRSVLAGAPRTRWRGPQREFRCIIRNEITRSR
jgi:hypothetical protein